jgi:hypothetical protein
MNRRNFVKLAGLGGVVFASALARGAGTYASSQDEYKRRQHLIDVFIWPGSGPRDGAYSRDGFNVERSSAEGMRICLVSDLNRNELSDLARLLIARR